MSDVPVIGDFVNLNPIVDPELVEFCQLPNDYRGYPRLYVFGTANKFDQSLLKVFQGMLRHQLEARRTQRMFYDDRLPGVIDICIDGSFRNKEARAGGRGGYGGIFFDRAGHIIAMFWGRSMYLKDNDFHEVEAVEKALLVAERLGLGNQNIRIRIDNMDMCKEILGKLNYKYQPDGLEGYEVCERKSTQRDCIRRIIDLRERLWKGDLFRILAIPRECNYPADMLSRVEKKIDKLKIHDARIQPDPYHGLAFGNTLEILVGRTIRGYCLKFWGDYAFLEEKRTAAGTASGNLRIN